MISDLDGANLRAFMDAHGGRTAFRVSERAQRSERDPDRPQRDRSRASRPAGPTNFDHRLKPDVAAPGGQILSSTLQEFAGAPFAVFDGTSMAAPHVAGAAALLLQQHPGWIAGAGEVGADVLGRSPAWGDTARTKEASVLLEGGGLIDVAAANDPKLFAEPSSLSFGYLDTDDSRGAQGPAALAARTPAPAAAPGRSRSSRSRPRRARRSLRRRRP